MNILVVDDNADNAATLRVYLDLCRHGSASAASGADALAALEGGGYDGVVLDHRLPDRDGLSVLRELRSRGGPGATVPVVMLTAVDAAECDAIAKELAALQPAALARKPCEPGLLLAELDRLRAAAAAGENQIKDLVNRPK